MDQNHIIGKNLHALRQKLGFTQDQVAEFLGINREEISYYENGKRSMPSALLSKTANLYGVDEYDFFEENMDLMNLNLALAFRAESLKPADLEQIAKFKKIVRNYLGMKTLFENESAGS
ncbi:Cro/Cl family transcriptional regulator [Rhodonellum psychrophilum GCM71 = DSM 17998]|uniref:Cro/Cl family transcriptional regulator n=2 Tax=Rhodonellum TaxID=336827 RepID=U5BX28_9BACT|nr:MULTISPECIES: helix-turn-helix transcriptional regulator [Rhodonellum]ERM81176.1 Cro/Cl family transcriptional regulator [Rhodonellum psychrophilum GCM71 = DSM 17998]SDZ23302.1 Transcriptional regulator, contains XRE-family HTH domain [Rhodonellum ikkaensis]